MASNTQAIPNIEKLVYKKGVCHEKLVKFECDESVFECGESVFYGFSGIDNSPNLQCQIWIDYVYQLG